MTEKFTRRKFLTLAGGTIVAGATYGARDVLAMITGSEGVTKTYLEVNGIRQVFPGLEAIPVTFNNEQLNNTSPDAIGILPPEGQVRTALSAKIETAAVLREIDGRDSRKFVAFVYPAGFDQGDKINIGSGVLTATPRFATLPKGAERAMWSHDPKTEFDGDFELGKDITKPCESIGMESLREAVASTLMHLLHYSNKSFKGVFLQLEPFSQEILEQARSNGMKTYYELFPSESGEWAKNFVNVGAWAFEKVRKEYTSNLQAGMTQDEARARAVNTITAQLATILIEQSQFLPIGECETPTPDAASSSTPTKTSTPTGSETSTVTPEASKTPGSATASPGASPSVTATPGASPSVTATPGSTPSVTASPNAYPGPGASATNTSTATPVPNGTLTVSPNREKNYLPMVQRIN